MYVAERWQSVCCCEVKQLTLINYEAILREVLASNAVSIRSYEKQNFWWVLPDSLHSWLIPKIKCSHLTGNPEDAAEQYIDYSKHPCRTL